MSGGYTVVREAVARAEKTFWIGAILTVSSSFISAFAADDFTAGAANGRDPFNTPPATTSGSSSVATENFIVNDSNGPGLFIGSPGSPISPSFTSATVEEFVANGAYGTTLFSGLPGYEDRGVKSGDFLLKSQVSTGVAYDSNILRTPSALSDYIFFVAPTFDLTRYGGNHVEEFTATVVSATYAKSGADDFNSAYVKASETYQLSSTDQLYLNSFFVDGYERRVSSNHNIPTDAAAPVHYDAIQGSVGYSKVWESFTAGATFTASRRTFDDVESTSGTLLDQTFRNESDLSLESFLNIKLSDHIQSNLVFSATRSDIQDQIRSSNLFKLSDTLNLILTSKTAFGFYASVTEQNFYNNPQDQMHPLGEYEAFLGWSPTERLKFTTRAGYYDIGVDFTRGFLSGGEGRYATLDVNYLLRRNLQLTSSFKWEADHPSGGQGVQTSLAERASLTYEINSSVGLSLLYTLQRSDSNSPQFPAYDENIFQTTFNVRF